MQNWFKNTLNVEVASDDKKGAKHNFMDIAETITDAQVDQVSQLVADLTASPVKQATLKTVHNFVM